MKDANIVKPSDAVMQSVEFHRNGQLLMTAGFDRKLRFFQIDGKRNPKVQGMFLQDFPIQKAVFVPNGSGVVAAGRRNFFFVYDLQAGKVERVNCMVGREGKSLKNFEVSHDGKVLAFTGNKGYIILASLRSKQCIGTLKMNGKLELTMHECRQNLIIHHVDHSGGLLIDLLQGLLKLELSEQLTAKEALKHPFFKESNRRM